MRVWYSRKPRAAAPWRQALLVGLGVTGTAAAPAADPPFAYAVPERRIEAPEARQGVAASGPHVYAVDNSRIARYAIDGGHRIAEFAGDPKSFPHLNSCAVVGVELVCASSNYPATPQRGTVELFDAPTLAHVRSLTLAHNPGSLTALTRHSGRWWAAFAHYDGKGGVAGRDHRATLIAELDESFAPVRRWSLPPGVLARLAPYSISGMTWSGDGNLLVSGHDKPEVYVLAAPGAEPVLRHLGTVALASFGQAIDLDPADPGLLWSIDRRSRTVFASRLPASIGPASIRKGNVR